MKTTVIALGGWLVHRQRRIHELRRHADLLKRYNDWIDVLWVTVHNKEILRAIKDEQDLLLTLDNEGKDICGIIERRLRVGWGEDLRYTRPPSSPDIRG